MISAVELEKYAVNIDIFSVIIGKLYHKKKLCPIILLKVDKSLEVGFYCIILSLSLAVYLQVKSGKKFLLDIEEIA